MRTRIRPRNLLIALALLVPVSCAEPVEKPEVQPDPTHDASELDDGVEDGDDGAPDKPENAEPGPVADLLQLDPGPDVSQMPPADLGFELIEPEVDASTGFTIAGKNDTEVIRRLTAIGDRSIEDLERQMRPGAKGEEGSNAGFLGPDENLLDVLAADNDLVLEELQLDHQQLAEPLLKIGFYARKHAYSEKKLVTYGDVRLQVSALQYKGFQYSPFGDGTRTNTDVTVQNLHTGRTLKYSLLVPQMVYRYGFYEGQGTSYRVPPGEIARLLQSVPSSGDPDSND